MKIVVYAEQFKDGSWDVWEHMCSQKEVDAIVNTAINRANGRALNSKPNHSDLLVGARRQFDVASGPAVTPKEGDTRVYCLCIDQLVIGVYKKIRQHSQRLSVDQELVEVPMRLSA
jgi:hypothetical protein